ncbi:hypothetical protein HYR54_16715 [Candidatus Acetothermia bacterium]|nr:hypothetical protein [Candidatus Acetothermia bacterium]MBI3459874.1 hypothetical protein [Candidatus Acetothermia bacterium]
MKITAIILGIVGGLAAFLLGQFTWLAGALDSGLDNTGPSSLVGWGYFELLLAFAVILATAFTYPYPKFSGILMLLGSIGSILVCIFAELHELSKPNATFENTTWGIILYGIVASLLATGGALAFRTARKQTIISVVTPTQTLS